MTPRPPLPPAIRIRIQALRADARRIASEIRALQSPPEVRPTWTCGLCGHMWVGARGRRADKNPPRCCTKCRSTRWNRPPPPSLCTPAPQTVEEVASASAVSTHRQLDILAESVGLTAPPRASRDLVRDVLASARPAPDPPPAPARDPLTEPSERNLDDYYALTRPVEVPVP